MANEEKAIVEERSAPQNPLRGKLVAVKTVVKTLTKKSPKPPRTVAFHHAGYPIRFPNTVIFRMTVSPLHDDGVRADVALLALNLVTGNTFGQDT